MNFKFIFLEIKNTCFIFAKEIMIMNQKLGLLEFKDVLLSNVSSLIFTDRFISLNSDFLETITYDLFNHYYYSDRDVSITDLSKTIEIIISNNMIKKIKI